MVSHPRSIDFPELGFHAIHWSMIGSEFKRFFHICEPPDGFVEADLSQM
jgi:hypothetical protein